MLPPRFLKILIDARMITNPHHGIARYTIDLIHGLNELGQKVSLILNSKKDVENLGPTSIQNIHLCKIPFASPLETLALNKIQSMNDYDSIHFPSFAVPQKAPWSKVVITIHDLIHLQSGFKPFHQIYYRAVVAQALKKAKAVIAVSEWTKNDLHKILKIPAEQITVIRNGLEPKWFLHQEQSPNKNRKFIALGNLKNHKNIKTLLKACRELWNENHDFKLLLSLGGADIPLDWLSSAEKNKVTLLKNVSDDELKKNILESSALISTSLLEGFNYPAAEALALGKPVILSRSSVHNELRGDQIYFYGEPLDVSGLKVEMKHILNGHLKSPSTHHNICTRKEMAEKTLEVYLK